MATKTKIGIRKIKSHLAQLAFAPDEDLAIKEVMAVGGSQYAILRALEIVRQYAQTTHKPSKNPKDLDAAVKLLVTARITDHGAIEAPVSNRAGKSNPVNDH